MRVTAKIFFSTCFYWILFSGISSYTFGQNVKLNAVGAATACTGKPATLQFSITGGSPVGPNFEYYYTLDGAGPYVVTGTNPHSISVTVAGTYTVTDCIDLGNGLHISPNPGNSTQTITALPTPTASITPDPANVSISSNLTLNSNGAGGTAPLSYAWTDGGFGHLTPTNSTSTVFNSAAAGAFAVQVVVTDANSCRATDNITVNVYNLSATVATTPSPASTCPASPVLLNATPSGGSGSYTHSWSGAPGGSLNSTTIEDPTFTYSTPGTYNLSYTVTDVVTSATASVPVSITVNASPTIKTVNTTNYCTGATGGSLTVVSSDANVNYTLINNTTGATVSTQPGVAATNLTWNNLPAADYFIRAVNQTTLCPVDYPLRTIVQNTLPVVAPTVDANPVCNGSTTTLHANAPTSVSWLWDNAASITGSNTIANPIASPTAYTNYTVTVTDVNGCQNSGSVAVSIAATPTININSGIGVFTICEGDNITLTGTSTKTIATWNWSSGSSTSSTTVAPGTTTTYTLTVVDIDGCTNSKGQTVTVNDRPTANAGSDEVMCVGTGVTLTATATDGTAPYSYLWSGGTTPTSQSTTVNPANDATYTVTVTDANGCAHSDNVFVDVVINPTVTAGAAPGFDLSICDGESTDIMATPASGTPPYTYLWPHSGASSQTVTVSPPNPVFNAGPVLTTYSVTVYDVNGCQATGSVAVTTNSLTALTIANDGEAYCQDAGIVTLVGTPGGGTWTDVSTPGFIIAPNTFNPAPPTTPTFYTVQYSYTNTNGCVSTLQATVEVLPYPTPTVSVTNPLNGDSFCNVGAAVENITTTDDVGGEPGITRTITSASAGVTDLGGGAGTFDPTAAGIGTHTITYSVTTPGCSNNASVTVNVGYPVIINPLVSMCIGDVDQPLVVDRPGGTWHITFTPDATGIPVSVSYPEGDPLARLQASEPGDYNVDYELSVASCANTTSVTCRVNALPTLDFDIGTFNQADLGINFCDNVAPVLLTPTPGGGSFSSTPPGNVNTTWFEPSVVGAGTYNIIYTYTNPVTGCSNTLTSQNIKVNAAPVVDITDLNPAYCKDSPTFTITGDPTSGTMGPGFFTFPLAWVPGSEYVDNGDGTAGITPANINPTGTFNVTYSVADLNGCTGTKTETFTVNQLPTVDFNGLPATGKICKNATPVSLIGSPTNLNGVFTPMLGLTDNGDGTATFDPSALAVGNHTITYTYTNPVTLCVNSISKPIEVLSVPAQYSIAAPGPNGEDYCEGSAGVPLSVTNSEINYSYDLIRNGLTIVTNFVSPANGSFTFAGNYTNGVYTVRATDPADGCSVIFNNSITVTEIPTVDDAGTITGTANVCADGTTNYTYTVPVIANAVNYIWTLPPNVSLVSSAANSIAVTFSPAYTTGSITVYGESGTFCSDGASSSITVTKRDIPDFVVGAAITGDNVVCEGVTGKTYSINPADFSFETSYEWQTTSGIIVSDPTASNVTVDFVAGDPLSITGAIRVRGVNACGTSAWVTLPITVNPVPNVSVNALGAGDVITCAAGSNVQLNAVSAEIPANITGWLWSASNGGVVLTGEETLNNPHVTHEGDFQVQIAVLTNGLTCYNTATISVGADKMAPVASIDPHGVLDCNNTTLTLQANSTATSTYQWAYTPPANIVGATNTDSPAVNAPGTYTVTVTDVNNSCTGSASTNVIRNITPPNISVTNPAAGLLTCLVNTVQVVGASTTPGVSYHWSTAIVGATIGTPNNSITDVNAAGVYTLTVTDPVNGCTSSSNVTVNENRVVPTITALVNNDTNPDITCTNTSVQLQATASAATATFAWSTLTGTIVGTSGAYSQYAEVSEAANYSVVATDAANGCQSVYSTITVDEDLSTATTTGITSAGTHLTCANSGVLNLAAAITGDAGGTYLWSGTGVLVPPFNTSSVNVTSAGTYTLTYGHSVTGCTTTANTVVTDRMALPTVSINPGPYVVTCANVSATNAITPTLTATGDANPLTTYLWTGPAGAVISNPTALVTTVDRAGTYVITATNPYGCVSTSNVTVTSSITVPNISVTTPAASQLTCLASAVTVTGGSTTPAAMYQWTTAIAGATITNPTNATATVDMAGVYTLTVTNPANGCTASLPVTVNENTTLPTITALVNNDANPDITCNNPTVQLQATAGAVSNATFSWATGTGVISLISGAYNQYAEVAGAGIYTVTATHPISGCTASEIINVSTDYSTPVINIVADATTITCAKPTIILNGSTSVDATNFAWTYSAGGNIVNGGSTNTATVSAGATYTLTAEHNTTGCPTSANVVIAEDKAAPSVTVTGEPYTITCSNPTPVLSAVADIGSSILWTGPGVTANGTTLSPAVNLSGSYRITATAANGCSSFDDVVVGLDTDIPDISVSQNPLDITCTRTSVSISGLSTVAGVSYSWTRLSGSAIITNPTLPTASVNAAGDFRLTVTAPNGCTNFEDVTVGDNLTPPSLTLPAVDDNELTCSQTTVLLNASSTTPGVLYSWSTLVAGATILNGSSPTPSVDKTGNYSVTVTNPVNGCTTTGTTTVNGTFTAPTIVIATPSGSITCTNPTIQLDATGTTNASSYLWVASNGGHILSGATTTQPTVDAAGRYTLTANHTVTGCSAAAFADVTKDASLPNIDIFDRFPDVLTCSTTSVQLLADASALTTNKEILWTTTDGNITSATNITNPFVDKKGTYVVRITNTSNGCYTIQGVTADQNVVPPTIQIDNPLDLTCTRLQVNINATATSVDSSPLSYSWTAGPGGFIVSGPTTLNPVVGAAADYTLSVTDNGNGCTSSSVISVAIDNAQPNVSVDTSPDVIACNRSVVQLSGYSTTPNVTYSWAGTGPVLNSTTTTPLVSVAGTYNLTVTSLDNGCARTSANVIVTDDLVPPSVTVNAPSGDITCSVPSVTLSASYSAGYNYHWTGPGTIGTPNSYTTTVNMAGIYTLLVTGNSNGCESTYSVDVAENKITPTSPVIDNIKTCFGSANPPFAVTLGTNVKWYGDATLGIYLGAGSSYTPTATTAGVHTYYATSTGTNGCVSLPTEISLTINTLPGAPLTSGNFICEGSAARSINAVGSNIKWYDSSNVFIVDGSSYFPSDILPGTYTYYATQTDINGCESDFRSTSYTVYQVPLTPSFVDATLEVCQSNPNPSFTVTGLDVRWYKNPAGAVISTGNTYQPLDVLPGLYTYYATQTTNQCESNHATGTITINPLPAVYNVTGGGSYCEGDMGIPVGLANSQTGVNYELWLDGTTLITDRQGAAGLPIDFGNQLALGSYSVKAYTTSGCTANMNGSTTISINFLPSTASAINGLASVCQGRTVTYSVTPIANATIYQWSVPTGMTFIGGTTTNTVTLDVTSSAVTGNISVYGINGCGNGPVSNKLVEVNSLPQAPSAAGIIGNTVVCEGQGDVTYSIDPIVGATSYDWTLLPGMTVIEGANTNSIVVQYSLTESGGNIYVQGRNACGLGPKSNDLAITINPKPNPLAIPDLNVCAASATVTTASLNAGETGQWSVIYGPSAVQSPTGNSSLVTNLRMGLNTLVWTLTSNGCSDSDTVNIYNNIVAVNSGDDQIICSKNGQFKAIVPLTGATWNVVSGYGLIETPSSPTSNVTGLSQGSNTFSWQVNNSGCISSDQVVITNNAPLIPNAGSDQVVPNDATDLNADQPETGTAGFWHIISGGGVFTDSTDPKTRVSGLMPGTNMLVWTVQRVGCTLSDTVVVENILVEQANAGTDQTLCVNYTTLNATRPNIGTGEWSVISGQAMFDDKYKYNARVTNLGQDTTILRWTVRTSALGITWDELTIVNNMPTMANAGPDMTLCTNQVNLAANAPAYGLGTWVLNSGAGTIANVNLNSSLITNLGPGRNELKWTIDYNGCLSEDFVAITNNTTTVAIAGEDQTICFDSTVLYPNTPTYGIGSWSVESGRGIFDENTVTQLAPGTNTFIYTITNGTCKSSDTISIINNKPTTPHAGYDQSICVDSIHLSANTVAVGSGLWTVINGSGTFSSYTSSTPAVTDLAFGDNIFRWTITNNGCTEQDEVIISNNFIRAAAGNDETLCQSYIQLKASNPLPGVGTWTILAASSATFDNQNEPNTTVRNLSKGVNSFRWTISNKGCVSYDDVQITNNEPTRALAGENQSVCSKSATLYANEPTWGTGVWSAMSGAASFVDSANYRTTVNSLAEGQNILRWTITKGTCVSYDEVIITSNLPVNVFAGNDQIACSDTAVLSANPPSLGSGQWSIISGAGTFTDRYFHNTSVRNLGQGNNVFRWTVSSSDCHVSDTVVVRSSIPTASIAGANQIFCSDSTSIGGNTPVSGVGSWTIVSGSVQFQNINAPNTKVYNIARGTNILAWVIDKDGCQSSSELTLTNNQPSKPFAGYDRDLCGDSIRLFADPPTIGTGYWALVSGDANILDPSQNQTRVVNIEFGPNTFRWTVTNKNCVMSDDVVITSNYSFVNAGADFEVNVPTAQLIGNKPSVGAGAWSLSAGRGTIEDPSSFETWVNGLGAGSNVFEWSVSYNGCVATDAVTVNYVVWPTADFEPSTYVGCSPLEVNFVNTSIGGSPYLWNFDDGSTSTQPNIIHTFQDPGVYTVRLTATAPLGNVVISQKQITVYGHPVASFDIAPREVYVPSQHISCYNYSVNADTSYWDFGDDRGIVTKFAPTYTYTDTGVFDITLKVVNGYGCADSVTIANAIHVIKRSGFFFPEAFTPNPNGGNGGDYSLQSSTRSNDVFYPIVVDGEVTNFEMKIFNRMGVLIFKTNNILIGWDGYYQGKLQPQDVYIYKATGRYNSGEKFEKVGNVLLLRVDN